MTEQFNSLENLNRQYKKGKDFLNYMELPRKTREAHKMYDGDPWSALPKADKGRNYPQFNFIQKIVKYTTASICVNDMAIYYSDMTEDGEDDLKGLTNALTEKSHQVWEKSKMEEKRWEVWRSALITGDAYLFFYNNNLDCQVLHNTDVILSDETEREIQKQKYILMAEDIYVSTAKELAKKNNVGNIQLITQDNDLASERDEGETSFVDDEAQKTRMVTKLYKKDEMVYLIRFTKDAVIQPETPLLREKYPIVSLVCNPKYKSARGGGIVFSIVNNQHSVNKMLAKREQSAWMAAFPTRVVNTNYIDEEKTGNMDALNPVVYINGEGGDEANLQNMRLQAFDVIPPSAMSPDAKAVQEDILSTTRDLAGVGDVLSNINPEQASGTAIIAVKNTAELPSNDFKAADKQMIEDIAILWLDTWRALNVNEFEIKYKENGKLQRLIVEANRIAQLDMSVKIDVTQNEPFSKLAQEQSLETAMANGSITFEEYVMALPQNSIAPKAKYEEILKARQKINAAVEQSAMQENEGLKLQMEQMSAQHEQLPQLFSQAEQKGMEMGKTQQKRQDELDNLKAAMKTQ